MYNRCYDMGMEGMKAHEMKHDMGVKKEMNKEDMDCCKEALPGVVCPPVYECPVEKVCHREIVHEVPHVCPVNTKIINHHIYRHTYSPCFTCCEQDEVCHINEGCCKY